MNIIRRVVNKLYRSVYFPLYHRTVKFFGGDVYIIRDGRKFYYEFGTTIGHKLFHLGKFEEYESRIMEKFLRDNSIIVDIGANIGIHTTRFALGNPGRTVYAFEPAHKAYQFLLKNIEGIENIIPLNIGITNSTGFADFLIAKDNAYSSLKNTNIVPIVGKEKVVMTSLDEILPFLGISHIDLIKVDVEGNDHNAISGMLETLTTHHPILFCEIVHSPHLNPDPEATIKLITDCGYIPYWISGTKVIPYTTYRDEESQFLFVPASRPQPPENIIEQ